MLLLLLLLPVLVRLPASPHRRTSRSATLVCPWSPWRQPVAAAHILQKETILLLLYSTTVELLILRSVVLLFCMHSTVVWSLGSSCYGVGCMESFLD
jgi:hypothetical protein